MKYLFQPIKIKNMELRNRIVMPAMHLGYVNNGFITDQLIDFYAERAKGGAGLILVGGCYTEHLGMSLPNFIGLSDDKFIEGLSKLAAAVHNYGAKIGAQLYHAGRYAHSMILGIQSVSASNVPSKLTGEAPRELSIQEIKETIKNFAYAALRAKQSNFDTVELIGSAGYLISQFLSPITNKRTDEYGGNLKQRTKFLTELIQETRKLVDDDFPLILRMSGDEFMEGGLKFLDIKEVAITAEKAGIDIINVTGGWHETNVPQTTMGVPRGAFVYLAANIKEVVTIPVIAANRINTPQMANKIIKDGAADMVVMGRALICDPYMPTKATENKFDEIRTCIACNQGCFDAVFNLRPVTCLNNPVAGREKEFVLTTSEKKKNIVIIGGGPAGLEAAIISAKRGHSVTLYEKSDKLGGQIPAAAAPPGRQEIVNIIQQRIKLLEKLNIIVHLNTEATEEFLNTLSPQPDSVIVATGVNPLIPNIPGINNTNVLLASDVLLDKNIVEQSSRLFDKVPIGKKVVIIGGGAVGCETAIFLAELGTPSPENLIFLLKNNAITAEQLLKLTRNDKQITILEMLSKAGKDIGRTTRWTIMQELKRLNIKIMSNTKVVEILDDHCIATDKEGKQCTIEADTFVLATGSLANDELYKKLTTASPPKSYEIYAIGDCLKPRLAMDAIYEAYNVARKI